MAALFLVRHQMRLQIFRPAKQLLTHGTAVRCCRALLVLHVDTLVAPQLGRRLELRCATGRVTMVALAAVVRLLVGAEQAGLGEPAAAAGARAGEAGLVGLAALVGEKGRAGEKSPAAAGHVAGERRLLLFSVQPATV